jgi:hypothetical protein
LLRRGAERRQCAKNDRHDGRSPIHHGIISLAYYSDDGAMVTPSVIPLFAASRLPGRLIRNGSSDGTL